MRITFINLWPEGMKNKIKKEQRKGSFFVTEHFCVTSRYYI